MLLEERPVLRTLHFLFLRMADRLTPGTEHKMSLRAQVEGRSAVQIPGRGLVLLLVFLLVSWATAALYFDFPAPAWRGRAAALFGICVVLALAVFRARWPGLTIAVAGFACVLIWWLSLRPSNDRNWQPDVARTAWAEINENQVTLHNLRNCDYRTETDYTPVWETRTVDLSQLRGVDLFVTYWGSPWIAHPIASFDFGDEGHVAISVETRKEVGENYSAIRGFFRYYELIYTIADERDVVRLRTNYRTGEEVYLYHTRVTPEQARAIFLDYLSRTNRMRDHAEWYNALTNNCTTNIASNVATARGTGVRWDWRILLNGKADKMLYERGDLAGDLTFADLKERAHINAAARAADHDPEFSRLIREGRPGFPQSP
jgi:hypothetical protein